MIRIYYYLMNKVAFVTGASRGIGRVICHKLAENGYNVVVTGKSITENPKLPGTIYSVSNEINKKYNVNTLPVKMDVRKDSDMEDAVQETIDKFGKIDVLINNAGALWWKDILNTPPSKYDLINDINARASYVLSYLCIPHFHDGGHIIMHSPPLYDCNDTSIYKNKTGYMISKYGMTMAAMGIAQEFKDKGIAANTIWPNTAIESYATKNTGLGNEKMWRKPEIIADAIYEIINENPFIFSGNQLIDDEYLKNKGIRDFSKYRCAIGHEPPKLNDLFSQITRI